MPCKFPDATNKFGDVPQACRHGLDQDLSLPWLREMMAMRVQAM